MSCFIEEPNCEKEYISVNNDYWFDYSKIQMKRNNKVLSQMKKVWFNTYKTIKTINMYSIDNSNDIMNKLYKLYFIELKSEVDYYNEEKIKSRKNKNYVSKKINKLKLTKQKI